MPTEEVMSNNSWLERVDRRVIYLLVALALAIPLMTGYSLKPAPMKTADAFYEKLNALQPEAGKIVLIASDWGPSTQAENKPQTEVAIEHLMRKRIPFALISIMPYATPYLKSMPQEIALKLQAESPGQSWVYGEDWVNFGYRPGYSIMIQGLAKASDLHEFLKADANGTALEDLAITKDVHTIKDIPMLLEFTGLVGAFNMWLQFFQADEYQPPYLHGCTSVTIPEAYNYYISGQIVGLYEGIAGAAWYEELLTKNYPNRKTGSALRTMTGISVAHLVIIAFIFLGNVGEFRHYLRKRNKD